MPETIKPNKDYFACKVYGQSMNRVIPDQSVCLFRIDRGGSRNGKIVLVERSDVIDLDTGSHYTVKEYESVKIEDEQGWHHQRILLRPNSDDKTYETLELTENDSSDFKVVGGFVRVLEK